MSSAKCINGLDNQRHFKTLVDHGASHCMINKRALTKGVELHASRNVSFGTTASAFQTNTFVYIDDCRLPEFSMTRQMEKVKVFVFENDKVDTILGRDFLNDVGIDVKTSTLTCKWCGDSIPFKTTIPFSSQLWK